MKLQSRYEHAGMKPVVLMALSSAELLLCLMIVLSTILAFTLPPETFIRFAFYVYPSKLFYTFIQHILTFDSLLKIKLATRYDPLRMEKILKTAICLAVSFTCFIFIMYCITLNVNILAMIGLFSETSLLVNIVCTYTYITWKRYQKRLPPMPVLGTLDSIIELTIRRKAKYSFYQLKPVICSTSLLILITHLPFSGVPNVIMTLLPIFGHVINIQTMLGIYILLSINICIDPILYIFLMPRNRWRFIRRVIRKNENRKKELNDDIEMQTLATTEESPELPVKNVEDSYN